MVRKIEASYPPTDCPPLPGGEAHRNVYYVLAENDVSTVPIGDIVSIHVPNSPVTVVT